MGSRHRRGHARAFWGIICIPYLRDTAQIPQEPCADWTLLHVVVARQVRPRNLSDSPIRFDLICLDAPLNKIVRLRNYYHCGDFAGQGASDIETGGDDLFGFVQNFGRVKVSLILLKGLLRGSDGRDSRVTSAAGRRFELTERMRRKRGGGIRSALCLERIRKP